MSAHAPHTLLQRAASSLTRGPAPVPQGEAVADALMADPELSSALGPRPHLVANGNPF